MKIHPLLVVITLVSGLHAQNPFAADPFVKSPAAAETAPEARGPRNISVCYETFSLPLAAAAKLRRERKPDADLYALLVAAVGKDGVRQESFDMVRFPSGNKALINSITEEIYPTEFMQPGMPATVGVAVAPSISADTPETAAGAAKPADSGGLATPSLPTSFDTRNAGRSLEIEATMGGDPSDPFVDLRLVPEIVTFAGRQPWGQGVSKAEMPVFETQRLNTAITVRVNQPTMLGTLNRPPVSQVDPDSAKRVWFAFVTVRNAKS